VPFEINETQKKIIDSIMKKPMVVLKERLRPDFIVKNGRVVRKEGR